MPYTLTPRYVSRSYPGYSTFQLDVEYDWPATHELTRAVFRIQYNTGSPSVAGAVRVGNLDENGNIQNKVNIWTGTLSRTDLNFVLDFTVGGSAIAAINDRIASGDGRIAFELHNNFGSWNGATTTHTGFQTDGTFFEPDSSAFTVIESGLAVPVTLEGESLFAEANDPSAVYDSPVMWDNLNGSSSGFDVRVPISAVEGAEFPGDRENHIEYAVNLGNSPDCTYSLWFKSDGWIADGASSATPYRHHDTAEFSGTATHNRFVIDSSGFQINGSAVPGVSRGPYVDNNWHHAAITRSGTTSQLYLDGILVGTAATDSSYSATHGLVLGTAYPSADKYSTVSHGFPFKGNIDDLAVFDRILTAAEISDIYNAGRSRLSGYTVTPLQVVGVREPMPNRFWDYEPIHAIIDNQGSIGGSPEGQEMYAAYGLTAISRARGNFYGSYHTEEVVQWSDEHVSSLRMFFEELSKYPPAFAKAAGLTRINMVSNMTGPTVGRDYGGVAVGDQFWIDIKGQATWDNTYLDLGSVAENIKRTFHHEYHHVMKNTWSSDFVQMESEWSALNSVPYIGADYINLPRNERPPGHFRTYGRVNYVEDLADIYAMIFTTGLQPIAEQIIVEDPAVAAKVQLMKNWLASKHPVFADPRYYRKIHEG